MFQHCNAPVLSRLFYLAVVTQTAVIGGATAWGDVEAVYELGPAVFDGRVVSIPLTLDVAASGGEQVVFFSIDVSQSDHQLTFGGQDFTLFEFDMNNTVLEGWEQIPQTGFDIGEHKSAIEYDTITHALDPGRYVLGYLQVDLSQISELNLPAMVSVASSNSTIGAEVAGDPPTFAFVPLTYRPGMISVPEPTGCLTIWTGLLSLCLLRRFRRDG